MITNKQQRDKIVKQLDEARTLLSSARPISTDDVLRKVVKSEELILRAIANLYRIDL